LYENRKERTIYMRRNDTQDNTKTENKQKGKKKVQNKETNISGIRKT
jgi:hypothetical protein